MLTSIWRRKRNRERLARELTPLMEATLTLYDKEMKPMAIATNIRLIGMPVIFAPKKRVVLINVADDKEET